MAMISFDPSNYSRAPHCDAATGVALAVALLSAMPKNVPEDVRKCARKVRTCTLALQKAWAEEPARSPARRPADAACDNAWSCTHGRLSSYAYLPVDTWPKAERAAELVTLLFREGLTFLRLPFAAQWAEQERRLTIVDKLGLASELDDLCGPEFLAEIRRTHTLYGQVLGITAPTETPLVAKVGEPLRDLQRVIGQYMRKLAAMAEDSDDSLAIALRALAPIDELRAAAMRRSTSPTTPENEPEGGEEPAPEIPPVTPTTPIPAVS